MQTSTLIREGETFWRPIQFPDRTSFRDFFPETEGPCEYGTEYGVLYEGPSWEAGSWSDRKGETRFQVSGYVSVDDRHTGKRYRAYKATELPDFLREYIEANVLHCGNDVAYFGVTVWEDGRALVKLSHNVILGWHWLGVIDAETIPDA